MTALETAHDHTVELAPVRGRSRIEVLDILRGIAILGIFYINLPFMAGPISASMGDIRSMGWAPIDQSVWLLLTTVFEGTQRGLLEFLFGAGMMVTFAKAMKPDGPVAVADLYVRRNLWLLAFGLLDIFAFLWSSDILHVYALCALVLFPFRKLSLKWLLSLGLLFSTLITVASVFEYADRVEMKASYEVAQEKQVKGVALTTEEQKIVTGWQEKQTRIDGKDPETKKLADEEAKARAGSMGDYAGWLIGTYIRIVGEGGLMSGVIASFSTMLLGIALWKLGFIQGERSTRTYLVTMLLAYGFGLTSRYVGGLERMAFEPGPKTIWITQEYARLAVSLGHVAAINLAVRFAGARKVLAPFKAAGQMAFSLYFMQQIIGIWVLYSPIGFHLSGGQGWAWVAGQATAVAVGLLLFANLWLRLFASGPFEWLWRSLTYAKRQPFRRGALAE